VNCEEEMREKNEMGEGGCMCVVGKKKKERPRYMGGGEKKGNKKEKRNGEWGLRVLWEKRGSGKKRRKKFEREKTKLVLFVCSLCLVQNVEL
jgi:hypothetical protein